MQQTTQTPTKSPMFEQRYNQAKNLYLAGDTLNALNIFRELNSYQHTTVISIYTEAKCLVKLNRFEEARPLMEMCVKHEPGNYNMMERLAQIYDTMGMFDEAYACYERLMKIRPDGLDETFNEIYGYALRKSVSTIVPVIRRPRFWLLANLFFTTMLSVDEGDVVECGCFRGLSSLMLSKYWSLIDPAHTGKGFHIMDSFEGLSAPVAEDNDIPANHPYGEAIYAMTQEGAFAAPEEHVRNTLEEYPDITFHKGWLPSTLSELPEDGRYRFVNVDVDVYEPTLGCFEYFWPRLVKGGVIISDDYGWPGAFKAINMVKDSLEEGTYHFTTTEYDQAILRKLV
ncbi:MAG: class I SAM-dependent methyltransferase [Rickettsiales bacterium]|nr:class I SAM-dependent methyltransferase [Rickettsiales bacterium]